MEQRKEYEEALEKLKSLLPPVEAYSEEYWERNRIINTLWCCISREEQARKAIEVLAEPKYIEILKSVFYDGVGINYPAERYLKDAFKPYWRTDLSANEILGIKEKYNFSDFELDCLIPINDFIEDIECHGIMDCDGHGEFVTKKKRIPVRQFTTEECEKMQKKGCEYVLWYNK